MTEPTKATRTAKPAPRVSDRYVVLTGVLTHRVGKEKDQVKRVLRGHVTRFNLAFTNVERLLHLGAIAAVEDTEKHVAPTARQLAARAGAADDPVKVPSAAVQPIQEAETVDPNATPPADENGTPSTTPAA